MDEERLLAYHRFTREHGVNRPLYFLARAILVPFFLLYFRLSRIGREHGKVKGPLIVVANHRSFLDPFVIGASLPFGRPLHYVAKVELFSKRWQGWILNRLGAYPVRRGQSDEQTLITSREVLERGGAVCIFPEGTRHRTGSLARPKRGFGRLALESGAAVLPVAVHGTEHVRRGWKIRPRKVKVRLGRALTFPRTEDPSPTLANSVGARVWPVIELQWEWLGGLPPLRKAAVIGAGSWGTAVAVLLARGGLDVQLGTRTLEKAEEMAESRANENYLPGVQLPDSLTVKRAADIELAGIDLVCLAVPSAALPQAVGAIGDRVGERTAVLLLSKGMVAPMAALPSEYVAERIVRARAFASLGGPAHAKEAVSGTAALVLGSRDPDLRDQLGSVFDEAGLVCERSADMIGVEVAGAAKNAAALAGAAAQEQGMNAAGIATAQVWRECVAYARSRGAEHETFAGIAGVGDLTATILAEGSRNRRAGELLGQGTPADQIPEIIGQASEALDSVPLIADAVAKAGTGSSALEGLAGLIAGEISPGEWMARVRQAERLRREPVAGGQAA
jgi:glycerol-3-phosphate dehydrogenase (NAD(P)+)